MVERKPAREKEGAEVPFGIRAIESGVEVEGVWVSRSNTPTHSSRDGSLNNLRLPRHGSMVDLSRLEIGIQSDDSDFDPAVSREPSSSSDQTAFTGRLPGQLMINRPSSSLPASPEPVVNSPHTRRYPPHSYSRYSKVRNAHRNTAALKALEDLGRPRHFVHDGESPNTSTASPRLLTLARPAKEIE